MADQNRRSFVVKFSLAVAAFVFTRPFVARAEEKRLAPLPKGMTPISQSDAVVEALGYHSDIKDIDYSKYPQRKSPEAKNQFCKTCVNFTPVNEGWGRCQILTAGVVSSTGWCMSWTKKT